MGVVKSEMQREERGADSTEHVTNQLSYALLPGSCRVSFIPFALPSFYLSFRFLKRLNDCTTRKRSTETPFLKPFKYLNRSSVKINGF